MRSTFIKPRCLTNCTMDSSTIRVVSAARALHATFVLQVQHARRVILVISCTLIFASLTMASPSPPPPPLKKKRQFNLFGDLPYPRVSSGLHLERSGEEAMETKTDTSHFSECIHIICVWISSPENIGPVYKTYMFIWGGGEGFKIKYTFSFCCKYQ